MTCQPRTSRTAAARAIGSPTTASQIPTDVARCPILTSFAVALAASVPGSQAFTGFGVAGGLGWTGSPKVTVRLPKEACFSRLPFSATSCSISPRVVVSSVWTSRTSLIFVALAMIAWRADSVARRFEIRAARSTTWPVTSSVLISSALTSRASLWSAPRVVSQAALGIREIAHLEVQLAGSNDQERGDLLVDRRLPTGRRRRRRRGSWLLLRRPRASVVAGNSVPHRREDLRGLASHRQGREDHDDDDEPGE